MNTKVIHIALLAIFFSTAVFNEVCAVSSNRSEVVNTEAGHIDFTFVNYIKYPGVYHKIQRVLLEDRVIDLQDGSRWSISKVDAVKGWERSKNLLITQNHAGFSTSRYALINLDLKLAVPASLVREPAPNKEIFFVTAVDRINDIITLNDGKNWIVHSSDRGSLSKINENDRVVIGVNTGENKDKSPYLLIDTSNHHFVRAHIIE